MEPERCESPIFSPPAGSYTTELLVAISSSTPNAAIHYTLDGSDPTIESTAYSTPIPLSETTTVRALAIAPGFRDSAISTASYTITLCSIHLTVPNGDEEWLPDSNQEILWDSQDCGDWVGLDLYRDGSLCATVIDSTENDGSFSWLVRACQDLGPGYRIQVTDRATGSSDASDEPFSISNLPSCQLALTRPNGGEEWTEGVVEEILWDAAESCGDSVRLDLSCDGTICATIAPATENDGAFEWTVEAPTRKSLANLTVQITELRSGVVDESDASFVIVPSLPCSMGIVAPQGDHLWLLDDAEQIRWESSASCGESVRIELLLAGGICKVLADSYPNSGVFDWAVERCDQAQGPYRIRVIDIESGARGTCDGSLTIVTCAPTITSPASGDQLSEGTTHTITWLNEGIVCMESVKIELLHEGLSCQTIVDSTANDGSFDWQVTRCSDWIDSYTVRLTGLSSGQSSTSDPSFSVTPSPGCQPYLISPNGDEPLQEGTQHEILWEADPPCGSTVSLDLLLDGGLCLPIAMSAPNSGHFLWSVVSCPDYTDGYRVRLTDTLTGQTDESELPFVISPPPCLLTVVSPNGDESWQEGSTHPITWSQSATCGPTVRIELMFSGEPCLTVAEEAANNGEFLWTVDPCDDRREGLSIRITDIASETSDASDAVFSIPPVTPCQPIVVSPNGGEAWPQAKLEEIVWTPSSCDETVSITLLRNGVACSTLAGETANDGSYSWQVDRCSDETVGYKIRVEGMTSAASDESDATFSIPNPPPDCQLSLLAPTGDEIWPNGTQQEVRWESIACNGTIRIELLHEGALCRTVIESTDDDGTFDWIVESCSGFDSGYSIRIVSSETGTSTESFGTFSIPDCSLSVSSPNGGEDWFAGVSYSISWERSEICSDLVRLELLHDGQICSVLADETPNDGSFDWVAETCGSAESGYQIQITDLQSESFDRSDGTFEINGCHIGVSEPNGGESWDVGSVQTIQWTTTAACGETVRIELLCEDTVCQTVAETTENDGSFAWVPELCCENPCTHKIMVVDLSTSLADESDDSFCLCPPCQLTLLSPNGGEVWPEETEQTIQWDTEDCSGPLRLELLYQDVVCFTIADDLPDTGTFSWIAQNCAGSNDGFRVRISDTCGHSDDSDATLAIPECRVTVVVPNGGESWAPGVGETIQWVSDACGEDVRIELLRDGIYCSTIVDQTPNDGTYDWTPEVCGTTGCNYGIRITDIESGKLDVGNATFCICPPCQPTITSPNGGESWTEGTPVLVEWNPTADCDTDVRIDLVRNNTVCQTVIDSTPNDGEFEWMAARCNLNSSGYLIRVTGLTCQQSDQSDQSFDILPPPCEIALTTPNGGESWPQGSTREISWSATGECGSAVRIELLLDGVPCRTISGSTPHDGSYNWTVAQCAGAVDGYSIRLTDLDKGTVDESDDSFSIPVCSLTLIAPNGGESWQEGTLQQVLWDASNCGEQIRIELLRNGVFCQLIALETPNDGGFEWAATNCSNAEDGYTVRVADIDTAMSDVSDAAFLVPEPPCLLDLVSPSGGEEWEIGSVQQITWNAEGGCGDDLKIELVLDGAICDVIADFAPNVGSYDWTVDRCSTAAGEYRIRVTDNETGSSADSEGPFTIVCAPCSPTILSPNGGEVWQEAQASTIVWEAAPCESVVRVDLLRDGEVCLTIAEETENDGLYSWVPWTCGMESSGYRIRITGLDCLQLDESDDTFTIQTASDIYFLESDLIFCQGDESVELYLHARNAQPILGYGIGFCYNPDVFQCTSIDLVGTRGEGATYFESDCVDGCVRAGVIYSAGCPPEIPPGEGPLLRVLFSVRQDAPTGLTTIDIEDFGPVHNTMATCSGAALDPLLLDATVEICEGTVQE